MYCIRLVWSCHGYFGLTKLALFAAKVYQINMITCRYKFCGHLQVFSIFNFRFGCRSKYYRQTLVFSNFVSPEVNSLFNRHCYNILLQFIYLFVYLFIQLKSATKHVHVRHDLRSLDVDRREKAQHVICLITKDSIYSCKLGRI